MKLTTERKSIIKQQILGPMYKTTVYTLVSRHKNSKYQQKGDITQQYIDTSAMSCCIISTYFLYLISRMDEHIVGVKFPPKNERQNDLLRRFLTYVNRTKKNDVIEG